MSNKGVPKYELRDKIRTNDTPVPYENFFDPARFYYCPPSFRSRAKIGYCVSSGGKNLP